MRIAPQPTDSQPCSLFGAGTPFFVPSPAISAPGARGRGQGPQPDRGRAAAALMPEHAQGQSIAERACLPFSATQQSSDILD
jgi:hypothetical protein